MNLRTIKAKSFDEMHGLGKINEKVLPRLDLSLKDLPEAKDWEVGKKYPLDLEVKMTGMHQSKNSDGRVEFEIVKIGVEEDENEEEMDSEDEEYGE